MQNTLMSNDRPENPVNKALLLAEAYEQKSAFRSALNIYKTLLKTSDISLRVKINLGNVYFKLHNYALAIKYYKMALDQVGQNERYTYSMVMHNIGLAFVQQNLYSDAAFVFDYIVNENADLKAYIHIILCAYAMRSVSKIRYYFPGIFTLPTIEEIDQIEKIVFLIAPFIEEDEEEGFNWCLDVIRLTNHAWIADNLEVARIVSLMKANNIKEARRYFDRFEMNIKNLTECSKINLSYVYLNLKRFSDVANLLEDCTSAEAYNNFGVMKVMQGDLGAASSAFQTAVSSMDKFYEANYNLALVQRLLGNVDRSQELFNILLKKFPFPCNPMAYYHILKMTQNKTSVLTDLQSNLELYGLTYITDPKTLRRIGELYRALSNHKMAAWYMQEALSVNPLLSKTLTEK